MLKSSQSVIGTKADEYEGNRNTDDDYQNLENLKLQLEQVKYFLRTASSYFSNTQKIDGN